MLLQPNMLYQFNKDSQSTAWHIVDDVVMGGESSGKFGIDKEGKGVFEGDVSLQNNGGFSSVRHRLKKGSLNNVATIVLRVKEDGKRYQFRIKDKLSNHYSYASHFISPTEWEIVKIPLSEMYPTFRGRKLNKPNFDQDSIEEIAFLIANKKAEVFWLKIDFIGLQ